MSASLSVTPSRQRAAILFADIHGYSRLMNKDELGTYQRVIQSIALIRSPAMIRVCLRTGRYIAWLTLVAADSIQMTAVLRHKFADEPRTPEDLEAESLVELCDATET